MEDKHSMISNSSHCAVKGCRNSNVRYSHLKLYPLPDRRERRKEWLQLIGREDLIDKPWHAYRICNIHFQSQHQGEKLHEFALPTLFVPVAATADKATDPYLGAVGDTPCVTTDKSTQTHVNNDESEADQQRFRDLCDYFLPEDMAARMKSAMIINPSLEPVSKKIKKEDPDSEYENITDVFVKTETFFT